MGNLDLEAGICLFGFSNFNLDAYNVFGEGESLDRSLACAKMNS
jgi:hypothetical protein